MLSSNVFFVCVFQMGAPSNLPVQVQEQLKHRKVGVNRARVQGHLFWVDI